MAVRAMRLETIADPDEGYAALLAHRHWTAYEERGSQWDAQEWLERALRWWEALTDRAGQDALPIVCYRGWDEHSFTATVSLLHPHTSVPVNNYPEFQRPSTHPLFDPVLGPEFGASVMAVSLWRRISREPPRIQRELVERGDADFVKLVRDGYVSGPKGTPAGHHQLPVDEEHPWIKQRLILWQEAMTARARRDGLPLYCESFLPRAHVLDPEVRMPVKWLHDLRTEVEV